MEMPEGWKELKRLADSSTAIIFTRDAGFKIEGFKIVPELLKEMAEALDKAYSTPLECGHIDHDAYEFMAVVLQKFKEWK